MKKHTKKAIDSFLDDITRTAASPANNNLFEVQHELDFFDEEHADNYHSVVAFLLFISRRCRLDIQTAVGYLTTRVSNPNEGDWKKAKKGLTISEWYVRFNPYFGSRRHHEDEIVGRRIVRSPR